ncbi:malonate decarboxylase subunit alpha [Geomicrobium sediminis]|uniref:Malonate decarboxylase alpha subunit n=1 Tax=Geomicrobium sediminis TaxID=1347788 RepID=A0ABS2PBS8_9BACL|nr:malonate decarboxylase alpha subunit [Geomicrobium sediminis]
MPTSTNTRWTKKRDAKRDRLSRISSMIEGKFVQQDNIVSVLERVIEPYDRVILEGNNQKQASFLSKSLANASNEALHHLHLIMSSVSRPEHLDLFENEIADRLDFSFSGPQSTRIAQMIEDEEIKVGNIHTYIELYGRLFIDLIPNVALVAADQADANGNLYTGANTEETPTIVEATAFKNGIVIAQVNEIVDELPRVDIPSSWVDVIVLGDEPYQLEALFTRDPRHITEIQILMAMLAIRGVYEKHSVQSLNHGIGFNTAAIELLLPTYGESLNLRGKICKHWAANPHPTLIPAIESGWIDSIHSFGGEKGMEQYIAARPDVFFVGSDGTMRSNRTLCQMAGQYAVDLFIGSTLQMDYVGNSSTVVRGRLAGFGGAPNMGHDPKGRRHSTKAWLDMQKTGDELVRGRKLVVQMMETHQPGNRPVFVDQLDAIQVAKEANLGTPPVMIYADDVTHLVTEEGVAYLYKSDSPAERKEAIAAVAGVTELGMTSTARQKHRLREQGIIATTDDLEIDVKKSNRSLLAAKSIEELVMWSDGLYDPPEKFRSYWT